MATAKESSAMLDVLAARGPLPEHADKLMLFGRLVGSWDIRATYFEPTGRSGSNGAASGTSAGCSKGE